MAFLANKMNRTIKFRGKSIGMYEAYPETVGSSLEEQK